MRGGERRGRVAGAPLGLRQLEQCRAVARLVLERRRIRLDRASEFTLRRPQATQALIRLGALLREKDRELELATRLCHRPSLREQLPEQEAGRRRQRVVARSLLERG